VANIKYSPLAQEDLQAIKEYISVALASPQATQNTISKIVSSIRSLSAAPELGSPLSSICSIVTDYRFLVCGKYLAFYRFERETVFITRILYGARNYRLAHFILCRISP
jgi:addiction module RelE/StbE family toxin